MYYDDSILFVSYSMDDASYNRIGTYVFEVKRENERFIVAEFLPPAARALIGYFEVT